MTLVARPGAASDIGLHRQTNEDAFVVAPPLFAVCDGMGGAQAGEVASGVAAETLAAAVADGQALIAAAEAANVAVYARATENSAQTGMGTTLTAVVLEGRTGHFVHIGDSRAYLLREGALEQLTEDHSLVAEMVRDGRLTAEEASVHPHRSILSRALGTEPSVSIDEFTVDLRAGDVLLICSDGLSGSVQAATIAKVLGKRDAAEAAGKLISEARKRGGPDNITAVVLRLEEMDSEADTVELPIAEASTVIAAAPDAHQAVAGPSDDEPVASEDQSEGAESEDAGTDEVGGDDAAAAEDVSEDSGADEAPASPPAGRAGRRLGCLVSVLVLLAVVGLAGVLTLSTVFFVAVDEGRLTVFSGLPVKVGPLRLSAVYRKSPRAYASLSAPQRRLVDEGGLHSRNGVMSLADTLGMWP